MSFSLVSDHQPIARLRIAPLPNLQLFEAKYLMVYSEERRMLIPPAAAEQRLTSYVRNTRRRCR